MYKSILWWLVITITLDLEIQGQNDLTTYHSTLLYRSFTCKKCGTVHSSVEQQFQFTEPQICRNPQCVGGENLMHDFF